jgi:3-oxoacyl-[acyl-carrier-protein] synthase II
MRAALEDAGADAEEVGVAFAHGLGLGSADLAEARALERVFGPQDQQPLVTAIKPLTGHVSAAAGGLELAAGCLAVTKGVVPPTLHCAEPDPECHVNLVRDGAGERQVRLALVNSFSFGGQSSALLLREPPQ